MQENFLFSVLIANFNNARYIGTCLDSIISQDYPRFEIILVDDGSTDHSIAVIESYLEKHSNITLYKNEKNQGVGFTKKRCIDLANGDILGFVDPDDALAPHAIALMVAQHQLHPQAALVYSNLYFCDEKLQVKQKKKIEQVEQGRYDFFNENGDISAFCSFKKSSYHKTTGINPTLKNAEDQDLYFKLYDVGEAILLDEPLYYYRIHQGGLSTLGNTDHAYFNRWKIIFARAEEKGIDVEAYFWKTFIKRESVKHWLPIDTFIRKSWLFNFVKRIFK